jgi:hypothetical protein
MSSLSPSLSSLSSLLFLLLSLSASTTQASSSRSLECGGLPCVPGVENLGRGFDVIRGEVLEANVVDLEVALSVVNWTNPFSSVVYGVPPAVQLLDNSGFSLESAVFRSSVEYAVARSPPSSLPLSLLSLLSLSLFLRDIFVMGMFVCV